MGLIGGTVEFVKRKSLTPVTWTCQSHVVHGMMLIQSFENLLEGIVSVVL